MFIATAVDVPLTVMQMKAISYRYQGLLYRQSAVIIPYQASS